ncbi:MAG: lysophospholipid acyltransferase family protein [Burkholderiaceae bacterium]
MIGLLVLGLLIILLVFPFYQRRTHRVLIRWWSGLLLRVCGVRVHVHHDELSPDLNSSANDRGYLMLINHVSWLDIFVINQNSAARFVAKSEIRSWPLVGFLVSGAGTIFIERGRRRAVHHVLTTVAEHLSRDELVVIFPEGTTSSGTHLLPFHSNLVQAAINVERPVLPVALMYRDSQGKQSDSVSFIDDTSFAQSIFRVCGARQTYCEVHVGYPIATETGQTRHEITALARTQISTRLGFDLSDETPGIQRDRGA